ncbi:hypothetical protein DZA24_25010 [Pseudomonas aeruginosa]|nr:hypothetical protein Q028_04227 [Pseudomonas aeruginosa BWHPSA015]NPZ42103.1 hypothetical protein [Pseudomonas aeruginosa]RTV08061.1 hypothetical protein DZA24_25010 [Pseudomonas aeruginosa]
MPITEKEPDLSSLKEDIARDGYAFVRGYCSSADALTVANTLGQPLEPWKGGTVQDLVPRCTSTPNTYSGNYGLGCFPFHTDLAHWRTPPRYLLLRCVTGHPDVPTLLLDGQYIFDAVTLNILTRAIFLPRRPRSGTLELLRLYESTSDGYCFRWDELFLKPASKIGDFASLRVKEQLDKCDPLRIALTLVGDTLLIDNWRMLHARPLIPPEYGNRKIQRIYLESLE